MRISSALINFIVFWGIGVFILKKYSKNNSAPFLKSRLWPQFFYFAAVSGLIWLTTSAVAYLFTPAFVDHIESNMAAVAAAFNVGQPIYTALDAPERYSLLYGPVPIIAAAFYESLGDGTILLSKLSGVVNCFLTLAIFYFLAITKGFNKLSALIIVGILSLAFLGFYNFSYWNRPDSYLILFVIIGLFIVEYFSAKNDFIVYSAIAIIAGLAMSCKLHALLYFAPLAVYHLESTNKKLNFAALILSIFLVFFCALIPFLQPNVSLFSYINWLKMGAKHGLLIHELLKNITFIAAFLILLFAFKFMAKYRLTFFTFCLTSLLIAIVASKPGAGIHHFIPIVPLILWFSTRSYIHQNLQANQELKIKNSIIMASFLLMLIISALGHQKRIIEVLNQTAEKTIEFNDFKKIVANADGKTEVGYTTMAKYESTFYKAWLVSQKKGLLMDAAALMDMTASGLSIPKSTIDALKTCKIKNFIFAKDESKWALKTFYNDITNLFTTDFKSSFSQHFSLQESSDFFELWVCNE